MEEKENGKDKLLENQRLIQLERETENQKLLLSKN